MRMPFFARKALISRRIFTAINAIGRKFSFLERALIKSRPYLQKNRLT
jgi:hypothetical protein